MKKLKKLHDRLNLLSSKGCLSVIFVVAISLTSIAQNESGFGIKGGLNYNANGDYFNSISNTSEDPSRTIGYHIGVFGKLGDKVYLRPELIYTKTRSEYDAGDFNLQRIDVPILVGVKVLGPVSVFAGPALLYIIDSEFENATIGDIENEFTVGLNFGIGMHFNTIGIDLRYERGFSENETTILQNNSNITRDRLDTRPNQLILSVSLKL